MSGYYILRDHEAVPCDIMMWAKWLEDHRTKRRVAQDKIGEVRISTVFLGLDHSFGNGQPLIFETMVFGGPLDQEEVRYSTWEEAERGHAVMVARVRKEAGEPSDGR